MRQKENKTLNGVLGALSEYSAKKKEYIEAKNKLLNKAKNFQKARKKNIEGVKNGIFPLNYDEIEEQEFRDKEENKIRNENGLIDYKNFNRLINLKNRNINNELVRKHFLVQDLQVLLENLKNLNIMPKRIKFRQV